VFTNRLPSRTDEEQKDIFAPVADLMVGVVFIFIILILALSLDLSTEQMVPESTYNAKVAENAALATELADLKARLAASERHVAELEPQVARLSEFVRFVRDSQIAPLMERLSRSDQTRTAILADMQSKLSALGVDVKVNPDAGTLTLPSTKLFASGQADPTIPNGRDTILRLGQVMSEVLPCYTPSGGDGVGVCPAKGGFSNVSAVYVEGHTDVVPFGAPTARFRSNWDHYEVLRNLRNFDGDPILGVSGYADTRPLDRGNTDRTSATATERDRRIEVRVIMTTNEQLVGNVLKELNDRLRGVDDFIR
jgi:chemotaxis protein MotB